ncbi:MAG: T9SS type A sorting domain-containing protein, partial [Chitinophagaceae bacterium]
VLFTFCFSVQYLGAQVKSANIPVKDNIGKYYMLDKSSNKRSVQNPTTCSSDTVEYPRYKATTLTTISVSRGRYLGQLYSAPKPITVSGFTFYSFIIPNPPTSKKMNLICNLYKAGRDSLPSGRPLRSDTVTIDSTFGGGVLTKIEKKAMWAPITMDSAYILTVETDSATLTAGVVTNNYANGDGDRENLNCGAISGLWYNGRNLNVNGTPFDCDILLHPYVSYKFGTDFTVKNTCFNFNDTIKFTNAAPTNMAGSKMYNRYLIYNLGYICHLWDYDDGMGFQYTVDGMVKYAYKQNANVQLISTVYGYRGGMQYGCDDTTVKSIYYKPDVPTYSGLTNICIGDSAMINAQSNDPGVIYEWYDKSNSTSPFLKGKTYVKYPFTQSDTMYIRSVNNSCVSSLRTVILKANAYPSTLTIVSDSVCAGSTANLKASANVGNVRWFTDLTGGLPFYSGSNYQTPVLFKDTYFYVEANNLGCIKTPRVRVDALVGSDFAPQEPLTSNDTTVCMGSGGSVTLRASAGSGLSIRWFNEAGTQVGTGATYSFSPVKRETLTYYADAYNGICGSSKVPVRVVVEQHPAVSSILRDTICKGDSAYVSCVIPYGSAQWYDAGSGGNLLGSGLNLATAPVVNSTYYIQTQSNVCISPTRTAVSVIVSTFPGFTKLWGDTICSKNTAKLRGITNGPGTISWYEYDTSTVKLATGGTYITQVLNGSKNYYVQTENKGCVGPMTLVKPTVKNSPFSGFVFDVLTWQQVRVTPINSTGSQVFWDFGDGFTSNKYSVTHRYVNTGIYKIKLVLTSGLTGCKDSTIVTVEITPSSLRTIQDMPALNLYPNPAGNTLFLESDAFDANVEIAIYDVKGTKVKDLKLTADNGSVKIDLTDLSNGIYLIQTNGFKPQLFIKD